MRCRSLVARRSATATLAAAKADRLGACPWIGLEAGDDLGLDRCTQQALDLAQQRALVHADQGDRIAL